jgi:putative SOS response-associated peptidase YedK
MPVILRTPDQIETWMTAPAEEALKLQPPLPDGLLKIVATGVKEDVAAEDEAQSLVASPASSMPKDGLRQLTKHVRRHCCAR